MLASERVSQYFFGSWQNEPPEDDTTIWFLDPWDVSCKMWLVFFWRLFFFWGGGWVSLPLEPNMLPTIPQPPPPEMNQKHTTYNNIQHQKNITLPKPSSLPSLHIFQPKPTHHLSSTSPSAPALACENCKRPCNFTIDIHIWSINSCHGFLDWAKNGRPMGWSKATFTRKKWNNHVGKIYHSHGFVWVVEM